MIQLLRKVPITMFVYQEKVVQQCKSTMHTTSARLGRGKVTHSLAHNDISEGRGKTIIAMQSKDDGRDNRHSTKTTEGDTSSKTDADHERIMKYLDSVRNCNVKDRRHIKMHFTEHATVHVRPKPWLQHTIH